MQYYHMALVDQLSPEVRLGHAVQFAQHSPKHYPPCHPATLANTTRLSGPQHSLEHMCMRLTPKLIYYLGTSRMLPTLVRACSPDGPLSALSLGEIKLVNPTDAERGQFSALGHDRTPSWSEPRITLTVSADVERCYYLLEVDGSARRSYREAISSGDPRLPCPRSAMPTLATCPR